MLCACLHKTVNMVVFLKLKVKKITTHKGEHSCKLMYRVVPLWRKECIGKPCDVQVWQEWYT